MGTSYGVFLAVGECFAIVAETAFIRLRWKVRLSRVILLVPLANLFSWWVGVFLG